MIVSPRDCGIARYAIRSLIRLVGHSPRFQAVIYCNGLSAPQVKTISQLIGGQSRTCLKENSEYLKSIRGTLQIGNFFTQSGSIEARQGLFETAPEIWSRELILLDAEFVAIIDPDFEIFRPDFVNIMVDDIARDPRLAFISTDYSATSKVFEPYAQEEAILAERWHTWFCIYRRAALAHHHDFTYFEDRKGQLPVKYDHSAMLQKTLIERHGYTGRSLDKSYADQFLHYGAFAQNRSLSEWKLSAYRFLRIGRHNGWKHHVRSSFIARLIRILASVVWRTLRMDRIDAERSRYAHEME
jgi:hypothetical protein